MDDEYCYYDCDDDRYASDGFLDLETEVRISYAKGPSSEVIRSAGLIPVRYFVGN